MRRASLLLLSACGLSVGACGEAPAASAPDGAGHTPQPPDESYSDRGPYLFRDRTAESGLDAFRQVNGSLEKRFIVESVGGGCALFDCDQDGDLDAYLSNGGRLGQPLSDNPSDALFRNDGRARFRDASREAGIDERRWTCGVRVCDVDGDGWSDLYLTNYGRNTLYLADGRGAFVDRTEESGTGVDSWSTGASFLDFDRDGDLDLAVANYVDFDEQEMLATAPLVVYRGIQVQKGPVGLPGAPDRFYVNEGGLRFREQGAELGMKDELYGFQNLALDFDADGWIDLFVANDSVGNLLWRNLEGRRFENVALRQGLAFNLAGRPQACMGIAVGDYNGDLRADLYVTNFADDYSTLYRAEDRGFFLDVTQSVGLAAPTMDKLAWATGFEDFDLDGDQELFAVNGHVYPQVDLIRIGTEYRQPPQLFELHQGKFREPPGRGGSAFARKGAGRGAASGDVDGDGDLDLLLEDIDSPPRLLCNDGRQGRCLTVRLIGAGANREAVGARVVARTKERSQLRLAGIAAGFLSSSDASLVFGLGDSERVDELLVTWPSGREERFADLPAGARLTIREDAAGGKATVESAPAR